MSGEVRLHHTHRVAWITIDRPEAKGALTTHMVSALHDIVRELRTHEEAQVIVLRGEGADFCAGSDFGEIASLLTLRAAERRTAFDEGISQTIQPLLRDVLALRQPIVAGVRGYSIGIGVMLLLAADLVIASETARISLPQAHLGHSLDHGESWLLPRRVGQSRALQICLLGDAVGAEDLERFGLANWLTADSDLEARTQHVVDGLLAVAPGSLWRTKALLRGAIDAELEDQLSAERAYASDAAATEDFIEAISARLEHRPPVYCDE
jgi:2-(1,2-epoxy-1,2-dihydrophenyl)acetyl-CoA isomerase